MFNRGVLFIDVAAWGELKMAARIERWLSAHTFLKAFVRGALLKKGEKSHLRKFCRRLWQFGVSQPPFLLALHGLYRKLPMAWNIRGLGRANVWTPEWNHFKKALMNGAERREFSDSSLRSRGLMVPGGAGNSKSRYRVMVDREAKVLHYNGKNKPWSPDKKQRGGELMCGSTLRGLTPCRKRWEKYFKPLRDEYKAAVAAGVDENKAWPNLAG